MKFENENLNPISAKYIDLINSLIEKNNFAVEKNSELLDALKLLYSARFTWTQLVSSMRLFIDRVSDESLVELKNYADRNGEALKTLKELDIKFHIESIKELIKLRSDYLKFVPEITQYRYSDRWRADIYLMHTKLNPLVEELRTLLVELVDKQVEATELGGESVISSMGQIRIYNTALLGFAFVIGVLISIMITRSILPPVKKLMEAAWRVANGDLNTEVYVKAKDEIGLLGGAFNAMVDALRSAEIEKQQYTETLETHVAQRTADLKKSEARIRAVYDNMGEGIIVIDEKGFIESVNLAAQRIFGINDKDAVGLHATLLLANKKYNEVTKSDNYKDIRDGPYINNHSKHPIELEGKRMDDSAFPMEMVVTNMVLGSENMRACIVRDITRRKEAEESLAEVQNNIFEQAHKSGMAEMATGVLHNIGNILNSVNVSAEEVLRIANNSKIEGLLKANSMLSNNIQNIGNFISNDDRGKKLPEYYIKIGDIIKYELSKIIDESKLLCEKTAMMKQVISTQQAYATGENFIEEFQVAPLVDDSLKVLKSSLEKWNVDVIKEYSEIPNVTAQKSKLLQVITNLIKNAKEATMQNDEKNRLKEITINIDLHNENTIYISVSDNGCGIDNRNLSYIFNHGFTTKKTGHGFGLHTSANYMTEMGGALSVSSEGLDQGSCFTMLIPIANAALQTG